MKPGPPKRSAWFFRLEGSVTKQRHFLSEIDVENETATCASCGPTSIRVRSDGTFRCKTTQNEYDRVHKVEKRRAEKGSLRRLIRKAKDVPCADCGGVYHYCVMDFDHREGTQKVENISRMVSQSFPKSAIIREMKKCDVVCANCHRLRTHKRRSAKRIVFRDVRKDVG